MYLILARPVLFAACLKSLPNDFTDALPTPASAKAGGGKDWRATLARTMFAWTFTESSMLFLLLVFQAANISSSTSRTAHFQFSLYALLVIHILLIPHSITLLIVAPPSGLSSLLRSPRTLLFSFIPVILSLILLSYIPFYTDAASPPNLLGRTLSRLIVLGTVILGLLSGFGAVTRAWDFLPSSTHYDGVPTEEDIRITETSLQSTLNDLQKKRNELVTHTNGGDSSSSWIKRVGDTLRGGNDLTLEIRGLETLYDTLTLTLHSQRSKLASSKASHTFLGRIKSFIGRLFAGYCVFRTFTAAYNTIFLRQRSQQTTTYPDIVTNILIWLLVPNDSTTTTPTTTTLLTPESISSLTNHISLLLIGLIILSSIGLVMKNVNRGIYLLSTLIQLRSSFPPTSPNQTTTINLFTLIPPYELFASLFDLTFLVGVLGWGVVKWVGDRLSMV
ncbi:hypothetical protein AGABI2DRAFT_188048 [Agaricus bisporus var. bisporus H97]|uniref:hypothetical protein n=1 Tax=Agaricus bisporus var. bisporus (strain H97 / ATCC MYA-4626 / FGSC 10389) TaxID=936046 RepID=UPI00029F5D06|nr:hypothetical protein AGABI2DRAFT_188048 [Agaricus bisporus var. bisporus H97]EKV43713.1 hypothetical protein AGABI2DRAFT_188048 [Agaricus bisporus var. bisporus H97]